MLHTMGMARERRGEEEKRRRKGKEEEDEPRKESRVNDVAAGGAGPEVGCEWARA